MGAGVAQEALYLRGVFDDAADVLILLRQRAQFLHLRQRAGQCHLRPLGDELGHLVDLGQLHAQHAPDVAHAIARFQRAERDDLRSALLPVAPAHVVEHLLSAVLAEVDVDVGLLLARRIHEALEHQAVVHGVDVRHPERVRHQDPAGAAPHAHGNAAVPGEVHEVPHDQEVIDVAQLFDDTQFVLQPLLHLGFQLAVPLLQVVGRQ